MPDQLGCVAQRHSRALVDEWSGHWDLTAPGASPCAAEERRRLAWPEDLGDRPDRPSVPDLRRV
eukprot:8241985-Pyramimonas_sp.AAC.1